MNKRTIIIQKVSFCSGRTRAEDYQANCSCGWVSHRFWQKPLLVAPPTTTWRRLSRQQHRRNYRGGIAVRVVSDIGQCPAAEISSESQFNHVDLSTGVGQIILYLSGGASRLAD